ncbi:MULTISPECIES: hypothetical protein [unclassified Neptuniibacter]|uniref:hypothetical protein n=1 Tax=unclassified Neptuniibacter TaxID=2630693 RepID=UPI000C4A8214|nr:MULTISPECIES: hypothetical protein [unclassified Neptuniibacter]MAY43505.1 hypothetical protein [Oceanospirillaceae bacterium]|tara:strand:- start:21167 stop:21382 length:216 start_codon:yes stop_codon:yes gene_type:complete
MNSEFYQGINQKAFKLVICYCPPAINPDLELRMTKLVATALLIGIESGAIASYLAESDEKNLQQLIRQRVH